MGSLLIAAILPAMTYLANTNATPSNACKAVASCPDSRQQAVSLCKPE
jgi:hypothetical protein